MTNRDYILFLFVSFGVTYFVVGSSLFAPIRIKLASISVFFRLLLYCAYCVGFWAGIAVRATWPLDSYGPLALLEGVRCGLTVMGVIALARAIWPTFLEGAFEHERERLGLLEPAVPRDEEDEDDAGR